MTIKENFITDVILFNDYQAFITGTQYGELIAWKWGSDEKRLVHNFTGHLKTISHLMAHPTKLNLFVSASLDNTIKIWCMDVILLCNFTFRN